MNIGPAMDRKLLHFIKKLTVDDKTFCIGFVHCALAYSYFMLNVGRYVYREVLRVYNATLKDRGHFVTEHSGTRTINRIRDDCGRTNGPRNT